jgi:ribosomal protein L31
VVSYAALNTATVTLDRFSVYDRDQDADILFNHVATSTAIFADLTIARGRMLVRDTATVLYGSLTNNAEFLHNEGVLELRGTSRSLSGQLTGTSALGSVRVFGTYSAPARASSTVIAIEGGQLTAPSDSLSIQRSFSNIGTFVNNGTQLQLENTFSPHSAPYIGGQDASAAGTTNVLALASLGTTLYVGRVGNTGTCSAADRTGCEVQVYDISSTTNPVYITGLDSTTGAGNESIFSLQVHAGLLYVGKGGNGGTCSTTVRTGCELQIYDISSTTNPVFVGGVDSGDGSGATDMNATVVLDSILYVVKDGNSGVCAVTDRRGCELMVFNISSTTNPVYVGGQDSGTGSSIENMLEVVLHPSLSVLYVGKQANSGAACSVSVRSGCEIQIFSLASTTNPLYISGQESFVSGGAAQNVVALKFSGTTLYAGKVGNSNTCSDSSRNGCELMVFDASSSTNPVYVGGQDSFAAGTGMSGFNDVLIQGTVLYVARDNNNATCSATDRTGCELLVFDISSTTNPVYVGGQDSTTGAGNDIFQALLYVNGLVYVGKNGNAGTCSTTVRTGCEILAFRPEALLQQGILSGGMTGASAFSNVRVDGGQFTFLSTASTTNSIFQRGTTTLPSVYAASNFTNNAVVDTAALNQLFVSGDYVANTTTTYPLADTQTLLLHGGSQGVSGLLVGQSALPRVQTSGSGIKSFAANASTTDLVIGAGTSLTAPAILSVAGGFTNNGTYTDGTELVILPRIPVYRGGQDSADDGIGTFGVNDTLVQGRLLYAVKNGTSSSCSSLVRSGCELMVFDVSSTTNPVYVGGLDSTTGIGADTFNAVTANGSVLYVGKTSNVGTCSSSDRTGCELMVFDISSTTNPLYVGGFDTDSVLALAVRGAQLYVGKAGNAGTCSATVATGCELMVFDISSTTNPVYVGGQDSTTGIGADAFNTVIATGSIVYVGKVGNGGTCSNTVRTGCELMVFDISSTTNPVYVAGQELTTGANGANELLVLNRAVYVTKNGNNGTCGAPTFRSGCELMVFDISSTTNPVFVRGLDSSSGSGNTDMRSIVSSGAVLYVSKDGNGGACTVFDRTGCELMMFDLSSTTDPQYLGGQDSASGSGVDDFNAVTVSSTMMYIGVLGNGGTCSATIRTGCELHVYDISNAITGVLTGSSDLGSVSLRGEVSFVDNASTTSFVNRGTVWAPPRLSVSGAFTNVGTFVGRGGTTTFNGVTQQTATGTLSGASAFHHLEVANTSGNGTTSQAVIFGAPVQTTGTFTMRASSSAAFTPNATNTLAAVRWDGIATSTSIYLRSSAAGTPWRFVTNSFASVQYVNVRDSFNASSFVVPCFVGCFDAGNNTNWQFAFVPIASGTVTLRDHDVGQVDNLFSFQNRDDGLFYRFALTAATETAIVDDMTLRLFGIGGIEQDEITDLRLYRDVNGDGLLDGGDEQVLGAGIMAISGETGTITFSVGTTSVATTSVQNYLVTADTVAIDNRDWLTVELRPAGLIATGLTSGLPVAVVGGVSTVQHFRGNAGGTLEGRAAIGGDAPAGAGVRSGGRSGGGSQSNEAGQADDGENIASDPDFFSPRTQGAPHNEWDSGASGLDSDGAYATAASVGLRQSYSGFGFSIPESNQIEGIVVKLDASGTTPAGSIQIGLSWDGGTTITTLEATPTLSGLDIVYVVGGQSNRWGRNWAPGDFSNANFQVRVVAQPSSNTVRLDALEVRVYHVAAGGGSGGGSEI